MHEIFQFPSGFTEVRWGLAGMSTRSIGSGRPGSNGGRSSTKNRAMSRWFALIPATTHRASS